MHEVALVVEVLKAMEDLFRDNLDDGSGNSRFLIPLDQCQKVFPQRLENYADMGGLGSLVAERVEKRDDVLATWMVRRSGRYLGQQFYLVSCRFSIAAGRFDDLECRMYSKPVVK